MFGAHPPRELDLPPDGDARGGGLREQALVGAPARGGDDEVEGRARHPGDGVGPERELGAEDVQDPGSFREHPARLRAVDDEDVGAALEQGVGRREAADTETGDEDAQAGPGRVTVGQGGEPVAHPAPTTHSA